MIRIFISYRHFDCPDVARKLHDYLSEKLDAEDVFMDVNGDFDRLKELPMRVASSEVLLVLIGPNWTRLTKEKFDRSAYETDWVRVEIETGLETDGVLVIPVLVNGAFMPTVDQVPGTIQTMTGKRGLPLSETNFEADAAKLLQRIKDRHKRYCGATRVHDTFPSHVYISRLLKARQHVQIVVIWSSLLTQFQEPLLAAIQNNAQVEILLLNPESICATQRSRDLNEEDGFTEEKILENVREIKRQMRALQRKGIRTNAITLKYYDATPSRTLYIADETALIGTHPPRIKSIDAPHTEVYGADTSLFKSVKQHFDDLWEIGKIVPLDSAH